MRNITFVTGKNFWLPSLFSGCSRLSFWWSLRGSKVESWKVKKAKWWEVGGLSMHQWKGAGKWGRILTSHWRVYIITEFSFNLEGYTGLEFWYECWLGSVRSKQCNVEFAYQLSICYGAEEITEIFARFGRLQDLPCVQQSAVLVYTNCKSVLAVASIRARNCAEVFNLTTVSVIKIP